MAFTPRKGMTLERRERAAKALNLRKLGHTYDEIGLELGISRTSAHEDVNYAMAEITAEPAEEVRKMELERLDGILLRLNKELEQVDKDRKERVNVGKDASGTIARLASTILQVMERRARLLGLEHIKAEINTDVMAAVRDAFKTLDDTPLDELEDAEDNEDDENEGN